MSWSWGDHLTISLFGQSHGPVVGVTMEGLPAGESINEPELQRFLDRRAPGRSDLSTPRREADRVKILSGLNAGCCNGTPLTAVIENTNVRSGDYDFLRRTPRPGHADYPARAKYGDAMDLSGGGPFSGRMTAPLCIAGGVCLQLLHRRGVTIAAHISSVGAVSDRRFDPMGESPETLAALLDAPLPVLDAAAGEAMRQEILQAAAAGDSVGGTVECLIQGLPLGLGGPLYEGLDARIASAVFGIPAVKGVEFGAGFGAALLRGSENNDPYTVKDGRVLPAGNRAGGVLGGISTGMPVLFRVAFKPTPSIARTQRTVDLNRMEETELSVPGRHDPCIVPRAVPVVEAAAALAVLDAWLEG